MGANVNRKAEEFTSPATFRETVTATTDVTVQGAFTASSGTTLSGAVAASTNVTVSGTMTASSGFKHAVTTSSSQQTLKSVGVNVLSATGAVSYTLPAVAAGLRMILVKSANSTQILTVDTASTGTTLDGSSATKITLDGNNQRVELLGLTSARWVVMSSTDQYGGIST